MAMLITVFAFFTIQILVLVTNVKADPQIEIHPSEIGLGSARLDINCSFSSVDHPEMAAFVSLTLSRGDASGQNFQELAGMTEFSPDSVTLSTQEKFSATGVYSQTGESFIHLTWDFPTATQGGAYQCVAHGLDTLGQPLEMVNISTVTVRKDNLNYMVSSLFERLDQVEINETAMQDELSGMMTNMLSMEKRIEALEYNDSQINSFITDLENTVLSIDNNISALQSNNSHMSSYITGLEHTVGPLRPLLRLNLLGTYEDRDYYVAKDPYGDIHNVMDLCKSYGGHLVEIDDEGEFNVITEFLNNTSGFDRAMVAGTDEASEGTWVFQSNNKTLPFTSWYSGGASTSDMYNCLALVKEYSWNMYDYGCDVYPRHYNFRAICEIPVPHV